MDNLMNWPEPRVWKAEDVDDAYAVFLAYYEVSSHYVDARQTVGIAVARTAATTTLLEVLHQFPLAGPAAEALRHALVSVRDYAPGDFGQTFHEAFTIARADFSASFAAGISAGPPVRPKRTLARVKSDLKRLMADDDLNIGSIVAALEWLDRLMWLRHCYQLPGTMEDAISRVVNEARGRPHSQVRPRIEDLVDRIVHSRAATWK